MINMVNLNNKEKKFTNLLLIIDDCISEVKDTEKDDTIISLFCLSRLDIFSINSEIFSNNYGT
jgi:hypothetical protein